MDHLGAAVSRPPPELRSARDEVHVQRGGVAGSRAYNLDGASGTRCGHSVILLMKTPISVWPDDFTTMAPDSVDFRALVREHRE